MKAPGEITAASGPAPAREALTVVIPTKDAADVLDDCLASVAWADRVLLIDMFSTDATPEVCQGYENCHLYQRQDYIFGNVNFGFDQVETPWTMRLDSDERITPELRAEIEAFLASPPLDVTGLEFRQRVFVLGGELRHGFGRVHYRKMLFRTGQARYRVVHEHEDLETSGTWLRTREAYLHLNYRSVSHYLRKLDYYTDRDIERFDLPVTPPKLSRGVIEFVRTFYTFYLKFAGFRDGWRGLLDATMKGAYHFVTMAKLRERWEQERGMQRP